MAIKAKKCILCGKPALFESMSMASPVCEECAQQMVDMYNRNRKKPVEIEDLYVPYAGDITEIREIG